MSPADNIDLAAELRTAANTLNAIADDVERSSYAPATVLPVAALKARFRTSLLFDDVQAAINACVRSPAPIRQPVTVSGEEPDHPTALTHGA